MWSAPRIGGIEMQFLVVMRDGSRYGIEAAYIEVVNAPTASYTLLGPVPGYERAILATFPVDLVAAILPALDIDNYVPAAELRGPPAQSLDFV